MRLSRAVGPPIQMAAGLGLFGLAGYVFVAVTGHELSSAEANLAIAFYFLVNVIGPGIFYAVEQVTSRATSSAVAAGRPLDPALRRAKRAALGLVGAVLAGLLLLAPVMLGATLHGEWGLFALVLATPVIAAALHLVRGMLGGLQRFGGYAATLAVEGVGRIVLCLLLAAFGTTTAWTYGAVYLGASVIAMLAGLAWLRQGPAEPGPAEPGPAELGHAEPGHAAGEQSRAGVGRSVAALAVASLFAQLLPNLAPLAVASRLAEDSVVALAFAQAAVIARIPLLLFFPVQTMLLPGLSSAMARGELRTVIRITKLTMAGVAAFGAAWSVLFVLLGPWVLRTFLNAATDLDGGIMLMLALSTVVLIAASAVQPALLALHRDHAVTAAWVAGSLVTLGLVLLPTDPVTAGAVAQLVGPALTVLVGVLWLVVELRAAKERQSVRSGAAPAG